MIRDNSEIHRIWQKIARSAGQALVWMACAVCFSAGSALAAPHAQPGPAFKSWLAWTARPVIRAGLCAEDGEPCAYRPGPYAGRPVQARRREPEPHVYEPAAGDPRPDCAERPVVQTHAVRETITHERSPETYEEPCGVKCWYARLRAGYCGRGCDYYRFRMTQFPEGRLDSDRVQVACR